MDVVKGLIEKMIGSYSKRELARIYPIVDCIEGLEEEMQALSDGELQGKTTEFKQRLADGATLDDILPEAFAVVREASKRVLGMKHFRVQLLGGIVLHQGRIAEMKTGEGKTLVATLPVYLNALGGKGVHVVTVNDYLAKRDSEWMGKVYHFLGMSVGLIVHNLNNTQRRSAYACDITYGTNNELGFDYLRDNMVIYKQDMVQRGVNYAIVDEVDSILVDEARTPLIISGAGDKSTDLYKKANTFAKGLVAKYYTQSNDKEHDDNLEEDYIVDEKAHSVALTSNGVKKAEKYFGLENLSDSENLSISHHINQAIKAHGLMRMDKDYIVKDGEIIIVDEFTGRLMHGRRYSDGLHQAIEAKEGVKVEKESKTLATITFQNYFRMYSKLAGMTGTAQTEETEFQSIYKLDVIVIPTNQEIIRVDAGDNVYKTEAAKFNAIVDEIIECNQKGQPALIGTISIEKSEYLSCLLSKRGVKHQVLNAKFHEKEAQIISQAGRLGAVTIATNMAGRGTDIVLGGNPEFMAKQELYKMGISEDIIVEATGFNETQDEQILNARSMFKEFYEKSKEITSSEREKVIEAGGLHIIGTERHESRRIDNQLRGRSGRQGDPGSTKFYISLGDDLMRLFGSDRLVKLVDAIGLPDDQPIEHKMLTKSIENAQKRVEGKNFGLRKHVLQFDDVMNTQREIIYAQRRKVLDHENLKDYFIKMIESVCSSIVDRFCSDDNVSDEWDWESFTYYVEGPIVPLEFMKAMREEYNDCITKEELLVAITNAALERYEGKEQEYESELMREAERVVLLKVVDQKWMDHIDAMDELRNGIYLRGYAQRDPVNDYKIEGFEMFDEMIRNIQEDAVKSILNIYIVKEELPQREQVAEPVEVSYPDQPPKSGFKHSKIGRNDMCPCGSGKKYKNCCGANNS